MISIKKTFVAKGCLTKLQTENVLYITVRLFCVADADGLTNNTKISLSTVRVCFYVVACCVVCGRCANVVLTGCVVTEYAVVIVIHLYQYY